VVVLMLVVERLVVALVVRWWSDSVVDWGDVCCIGLHCMVLCVAEGALLIERIHPLVIAKDPWAGKSFVRQNSNTRIKQNHNKTNNVNH
jgi:hypothetical protein